VLSTRHVLAFLDIMPLTRGHVLVVTRGHWEDLGKVGVGVGMEVRIILFPLLDIFFLMMMMMIMIMIEDGTDPI